MNKNELTAQVAKKTGITNTMALGIVDAIFQTIQEALEDSQSTTIQGFGSFSVIQRAARNGINPSTKKPMTIKARKVAKFSASKKIVIK